MGSWSRNSTFEWTNRHMMPCYFPKATILFFSLYDTILEHMDVDGEAWLGGTRDCFIFLWKTWLLWELINTKCEHAVLEIQNVIAPLVAIFLVKWKPWPCINGNDIVKMCFPRQARSAVRHNRLQASLHDNVILVKTKRYGRHSLRLFSATGKVTIGMTHTVDTRPYKKWGLMLFLLSVGDRFIGCGGFHPLLVRNASGSTSGNVFGTTGKLIKTVRSDFSRENCSFGWYLVCECN